LNNAIATTAVFPDVGWYKGLAGFLESDEDFRQHCIWLTARIGFRCDQEIVVVTFDRGMVLDVQCGFGEYDWLISGTRAQWDVLFDQGWGLVRLYRSGTLTIRGDPVRLMQNWKAVFFIVEGMKKFHRP
jgi:hypothetical protein